MSLLLNRAKAATATTGTGTVDLGAAVVPYQSWATAGAVSGRRYTYLIEEGNDWEIGEGVYTDAATDTLTRVLIASSTGALLNLTGVATVACVAKSDDADAKLFTNGGAGSGQIAVPLAEDGAYAYQIDGYMQPSTDVTGFGLQVSIDNAASFLTGATDYKSGTTSSTGNIIVNTAVGSGRRASFSLTLFGMNVGGGGSPFSVAGTSFSVTSAGGPSTLAIGGCGNSLGSNTYNGFRIVAFAGNMNACKLFVRRLA